MISLGIDFDNTIVCYDDVFHRAAREKELIPLNVAENKAAVRDYLRAAGREDDWTELQGYIYGARMELARPFPGVLEFLARCVRSAIDVRIISHKTRTPFRGQVYDLHAAARQWLEAQGMFDPGRIGLAKERVFFELTKADKLARIGGEGCTVFIDDLPELLAEPDFPPGVRRLLFDPAATATAPAGVDTLTCWADISRLLLGDGESAA